MVVAPKSYLIISTRHLGDALLVTPIAHSIRQAKPDAQIDVLVLQGFEGMWEGNLDINQVITSPHRTGFINRLKEYKALWRRYDVALATTDSDRARWYAFIAGRQTTGFYTAHTSWISKHHVRYRQLFDNQHTHTVTMGLSLLNFFDIPKIPRVVAPTSLAPYSFTKIQKPYIVLHCYPKFNYKAWDLQRWIELVLALNSKGFSVALTGGSGNEEERYIEHIATTTGATSFAGKLSIAQTADLIKSSALFVGVDSGIAHVAAALSVPTVVLLGPTNPIKWGPLPINWDNPVSPWSLIGNQQKGNIFLIQGKGHCVPCQLEGCDRHRGSYSKCLAEISVSEVLQAASTALSQ
jgi:heptosyltransferase-3